MKTKDIVLGVIALIIVVVGSWYAFYAKPAMAPVDHTGVNPAASPYTYVNSSADTILTDAPNANATVSGAFTVSGRARGPWYFEASFPIEILDANGNTLFQGPVQATGDWMTNDFVPFSVNVTVAGGYTGPATIVLKKDNPSGEPARDASLSFPVTIQ